MRVLRVLKKLIVFITVSGLLLFLLLLSKDYMERREVIKRLGGPHNVKTFERGRLIRTRTSDTFDPRKLRRGQHVSFEVMGEGAQLASNGTPTLPAGTKLLARIIKVGGSYATFEFTSLKIKNHHFDIQAQITHGDDPEEDTNKSLGPAATFTMARWIDPVLAIPGYYLGLAADDFLSNNMDSPVSYIEGITPKHSECVVRLTRELYIPHELDAEERLSTL
ncbi:MAG: hypothetical protein LC778_20720 [Acidobacteria bacterium]|nr:hypothetical protein [Acidobacteriota bacterium]